MDGGDGVDDGDGGDGGDVRIMMCHFNGWMDRRKLMELKSYRRCRFHMFLLCSIYISY